jgi:hypothetical protein
MERSSSALALPSYAVSLSYFVMKFRSVCSELAVPRSLLHRPPVREEPQSDVKKIVGQPRNRSAMERFDRLQATVAAVASRPLMKRGTVLRFRTFDEFEAWKRQATRDHRASRTPPTS